MKEKIPFVAFGGEELEEINKQKLCNPKSLRCRDCEALLILGESKPKGLICGSCKKCKKDYLIAIEGKE